jgi:hypothetical protein
MATHKMALRSFQGGRLTTPLETPRRAPHASEIVDVLLTATSASARGGAVGGAFGYDYYDKNGKLVRVDDAIFRARPKQMSTNRRATLTFDGQLEEQQISKALPRCQTRYPCMQVRVWV